MITEKDIVEETMLNWWNGLEGSIEVRVSEALDIMPETMKDGLIRLCADMVLETVKDALEEQCEDENSEC